MAKIKVLHYLRHLGLGGTEKTCQLFIENASQDFDVSIAYEKTGTHPRLDSFKAALHKAGCPGQFYEVDSYAGQPENPPNSRALQELIGKIKPDILHVYRSGYPEFPVGAVYGPRVVETNVFGMLDGDSSIARTLFMSKWLMDHSLGRTQIPAWRLRHPQLADRFDFVNNPVDKPHTTDRFGLPDEDVLWLGRCGRPDNGIYHSINVRAAHELREEGYNLGFFVVAPPSNMIDDLEKFGIPFQAFQPTTDPDILSRFYNTIDIYAHARADGETFGVNIAEAMMHGKPVVTHVAEPSFPGMGVFQSQQELVTHGLTGFIAENTVESYKDHLKQLIDNKELREKFGAAGKAKARGEYYAPVCQLKLERIYREVVND